MNPLAIARLVGKGLGVLVSGLGADALIDLTMKLFHSTGHTFNSRNIAEQFDNYLAGSPNSLVPIVTSTAAIAGYTPVMKMLDELKKSNQDAELSDTIALLGKILKARHDRVEEIAGDGEVGNVSVVRDGFDIQMDSEKSLAIMGEQFAQIRVLKNAFGCTADQCRSIQHAILSIDPDSWDLYDNVKSWYSI